MKAKPKEKKTVSVNVELEYVEYLKKYCEIQGISFSDVMNTAMINHAKKLKKDIEKYRKIIELK